MRLLFGNKFFYLKGGAERVFFQERDFLLEQGHHIIDFSMQDARNFPSPYSLYFINNIDYHQHYGVVTKVKQAIKFIHSSEAIHKLEKMLAREQPEIAHLHNIYHQLTPAIIPILKRHGIKVVLTLHDCKLVCPAYLALNKGKICTACHGRHFWQPILLHCQNSWGQESLLSMEAFWHKWRKSYDGVDLFLAPSRFMADLTAQRVAAGKIRVLRNGIDTEIYQPAYQDDGYALYLGRLSREKGLNTLLKAHRNIKKNIVLKIVGSGPLENELHNSYPGAEFLGYKKGKELENLIADAGFVVIPSECYENCSMAVLEAMALGKPVVGSRVGGIPEQIEDGKTGFLFAMGNENELGEIITLLSAKPDMRRTMGKAARTKLENEYSLQQHCEGLVEIYRGLLNDH